MGEPGFFAGETGGIVGAKAGGALAEAVNPTAWNDVEGDLERGWSAAKRDSRLAWSEAKDAVRDGWHYIERKLRGDADRDGR